MNAEEECKGCGRAIRWGQTNDDGKALAESARMKCCWDCEKAYRDSHKHEVPDDTRS